MITLKEAREQLLSQIELEANCRIHKSGSKATEKLLEFYNHIADLPLSNPIFAWYRVNADNVRIECIDNEVRIYKADDEDNSLEKFIRGISKDSALDTLIDQALDNNN